MTKRQIIQKLTNNGIQESAILEAGRDEVEIGILDSNTGRCDYDATETIRQKVSQILGWGGFKTGYDSWVLRPNYQSLGDWNDSSSRWHY